MNDNIALRIVKELETLNDTLKDIHSVFVQYAEYQGAEISPYIKNNYCTEED